MKKDTHPDYNDLNYKNMYGVSYRTFTKRARIYGVMAASEYYRTKYKKRVETCEKRDSQCLTY
jgi:hypothetical protein